MMVQSSVVYIGLSVWTGVGQAYSHRSKLEPGNDNGVYIENTRKSVSFSTH